MARKRIAKKAEGSSEPSVFNSEDNSTYLNLQITDLYCFKCRVLSKISEMKEDSDGYYSCKNCGESE